MPRATAAPGRGATSAPAARFVAWLSRHSGAVVAATMLLALAAALSLLRLRLDIDLLSMLPEGRPRFTDYRDYVERFGGQDLAIALVRGPDPTSVVRFADAYATALAAEPEVAFVRHRIDLRAFQRALRDGALPRLLPLESYGELSRRLEPASIHESVRTVRRILSAPGSVGTAGWIAEDPLGLSRLLADALAKARPDRSLAVGNEVLLSPDGTRLVMLVRPVDSDMGIESADRLADALARAEAKARAATGAGAEVSVGTTGAFAYSREDSAVVRRDMATYSALALLTVLAIFFAGYRDLRILPYVAAELLVSTLLTFAAGLLVYGQLNAVSLGFAAIFFGLSIDAAIHFYTRFLEEWDGGEALEPALAAAAAALFWPMVVASATTAAVFVVIGFSALAGVAQLGYLTAFGMMLNVPATFVVLPAMLLWLHRRGFVVARWHTLPPTARLAAVARAAAAHPRAVALLGVALLGLSGLAATRGHLDMNLFHLRPARSAAAAVQDEITQSFGITDPEASVVVEAAAPRGAPAGDVDEAVLRAAERVAARLAELRDAGLVRSFTSPAPIMPSRATQEARLRAWAALPRDAAADALARDLEGAGFAAAPFAGALAALRSVPAPVDASDAPLPGLELLFDHHLKRDARGLALQTPVSARDPEALEQLAERLPGEIDVPAGVRILVAGRPLMERELHRAMRREIAWFLVFSLASNAIVIWLHERSLAVTAALLAVPLGVVVVLLGVGAATGASLNPVNLIVLPLTIGMGVDYCVYLRARANETGSWGAATASAGRAILVTAATTVAGFGILGLSSYPALSSLGALAAESLTLCFACAIAFLPAILRDGETGREN